MTSPENRDRRYFVASGGGDEAIDSSSIITDLLSYTVLLVNFTIRELYNPSATE